MAESQGHETFFEESNDTEHNGKQRPRSRRPSIRKTLSLIIDSRRTSIDSTADPLSPSSVQPRLSFSFSKRSSTPTVQQPQTPSQYYQDPEARMKLKMVLASPKNFDQALEHGFPSATTPEAYDDGIPRLPSIPKLRSSPGDENTQTFLMGSSFFDDGDDDHAEHGDVGGAVLGRRGESGDEEIYRNAMLDDSTGPWRNSDDAGGYYDNDGDEEISAAEYDSPITPQERISHNAGDSSVQINPETSLPLSSPRKPQAFDESMWSGNREMTLRMTLTKPGLRAPEEQLYGWQQTKQKEDPLALEALPAMRDHSALPGKTARKASLWKRMRAGSRGG